MNASKTTGAIVRHLFLLVIAALLLSNADGDNFKTWDVSNPLAWKDYRDTLVTASRRAAHTVSAVHVTYHQDGSTLTITAVTEMDLSRSWANSAREKSDDALAHEQYHFNITEYWGRKLKQDISATRFTAKNMKEMIQTLQREDKASCLDTEKEYDSDTKYGENKQEQKKWEKQIDALLKSSEQYAAPSIAVPVK